MRIKSLRLQNHKILGDLEVKFTSPDGKISDTVIIAGDNGTGKTALLNVIYEFSQFPQRFNQDHREIREFVVVFSEKEIEKFRQYAGIDSVINNELTFIFDNLNASSEKYLVKFDSKKGEIDSHSELGFGHLGKPELLPIYRSIYAETEVNFRLNNRINSTTSKSVDLPMNESIRSNVNLAQEIVQLLIDTKASDAEDFQNWAVGHIGEKIPSDNEILKPRFTRFENAFNNMFPNKRFKEIRTRDGYRDVIFEEYGKETSIENLSSGEKQIVYRGCFVLSRQLSKDEHLLIIDEPEISLHPDWQFKIVPFYRNLFTDTQGNQNAQIFLATHSPFIIHNAVDEQVVVLTREQSSGKVKVDSSPSFYSWDKRKKINKAFNVDFSNLSQNTILFVEGDTDVDLLKTAWEKLYPDKEIPFEVQNAYDKNVMRTMMQREDPWKKSPDKTFVCMFDFDSAFSDWNGLNQQWEEVAGRDESAGLLKKHKLRRGYSFVLPVPAFRSNIASRQFAEKSQMSIEFLFPDDKLSNHWSEEDIPGSQDKRKYFTNTAKQQIVTASKSFDVESFDNFEPIFNLLKCIVDKSI